MTRALRQAKSATNGPILSCRVKRGRTVDSAPHNLRSSGVGLLRRSRAKLMAGIATGKEGPPLAPPRRRGGEFTCLLPSTPSRRGRGWLFFGLSAQSRQLFLRQPVELRPTLPLRRGLQLPARRVDVAPARGADRGGDAGFEDDVREGAHALRGRGVVRRAGPGVERDQIDLGGQLVLADQADEFARVLVRIVLVAEHHILERDSR